MFLLTKSKRRHGIITPATGLGPIGQGATAGGAPVASMVEPSHADMSQMHARVLQLISQDVAVDRARRAGYPGEKKRRPTQPPARPPRGPYSQPGQLRPTAK